MSSAFSPLLCCPQCRADLEDQGNTIICTSCASRFPVQDGVIDFYPDYAGSKKFLQWAMEKNFIVGIYENVFRPLFTKFFSKATVDYSKESKWLDVVLPPKVSTVLDLAAGTGRYTQEVTTLRHPDTIVTMDISMPMLVAAKQRNEALGIKNAIYIRADAHHIPLKNGVIDTVLCFGAFHLFERPADAFAGIAKALKAGGILAGLTAGSGPIKKKQEAIFAKLLSWTFFDESWLRNTLSVNAMTLQRFDLNSFVLMLSAQKNQP